MGTVETLLLSSMKVLPLLMIVPGIHSFMLLPLHTFHCATYPFCFLDPVSGQWASKQAPNERSSEENACWIKDSNCLLEPESIVEEFEDTETAETCHKKCENNDNCKFFTFLYHRGKSRCTLLRYCRKTA